MKNIKPIETFLLEALRDDWKGTIELNTIQKKYFGRPFNLELIEEVIKDVIDYLMSDGSEFMEYERELFKDLDTPQFLKRIESITRTNCSSVIEEITQNKNIFIYRAIDVNKVWLDLFLNKEDDEVHLGKYWTYVEGVADTHWGKNRPHFIKFECKINTQDIDIFNTLYQNVIECQEFEITLFPNTPLELLSITIDGKEVNLSNFKNKEIYA
jgi:hypothetical protein